jgi:hypothetical protein
MFVFVLMVLGNVVCISIGIYGYGFIFSNPSFVK